MEHGSVQMPSAQLVGLGPYFHSIADLGRVTGEEEVRLARDWREARRPEARERLITANLRLVIALARRYSGRGVPLEELVAEGNVGLIHAVDNFDPAAGCRFSTYAAYWIRQSIGQAFASAVVRTKLSRKDRLEIGAVEKAAGAFIAQHGHGPTGGELAGVLGWQPERVRAALRLLAARVQTHSLNDASPGALAESQDERPDRTITHTDAERDTAGQLERLLVMLTPGERRAVELRYGLDSGRPRHVSAVASILGMQPRALNTLLKSAFSKLARRGSILRRLSSFEEDAA